MASRGEAVGWGWFGPRVTSRVAPRIGDVVVVANTDGAVIRSAGEPLQSRLVGHHGSLTPAEMLVPLYTIR